MGLFSNMYTKEGPGVPKNAPKKKGLARFFEIVVRDYGMLWRMGILVTLCFLPCILAAAFTVLSYPYLGLVLIGFVVYLAAAALVGPALTGMHAVVVTCVRDEPCYMMHVFKKAWKDNWRQSVPAGILMMLLLGVESFLAFYYLFLAGSQHYILSALVVFCLMVVTCCSLLVFLQMLFLALPLRAILKNSLLMLFGYAKRTLPAGLLVLVAYGAMFMFLVWPLWVVVVLLAIPSLLCVATDQLLWPVMESCFHITEQQAAKKLEEENV